jgi:cobaltochelatase CobT
MDHKMAIRQPIAFLSYVRSDDQHDDGRITRFRERLEGEVKMQTGRPFAIFQDRNDIRWGQQWDERITQSLADVTFLIPIVTPSFFESPACRNEFNAFLLREKTLGMNRLILPVLYLDCDLLSDDRTRENPIADVLKERQWTDWRSLRFKAFDDEKVLEAMADMAKMIKGTMEEIDAIIIQSQAGGKGDSEAALIESAASTQIHDEYVVADTYSVPEARLPVMLDTQHLAEALAQPYYAYTRQFDETVKAQELSEPGELMRLYNYLVRNASSEFQYRSFTKQISNRFRLADSPPSISISLLLDNSGSMRGTKIVALARSILFLTGWLERWQIRSEVLGFTTRAWKGGQSRELWLADGKPSRPGRLNDLRHIIYKSFDDPLTSASPGFGIMVREGLLKENIDGEALLWAYSRLVQENSKTKVLCMFTDGASVDDSTLGVNPGDFLINHFETVVRNIEDNDRVSLSLIGINKDVSSISSNAVLVDDERFAVPIFNILKALTADHSQ